MKSIKRISRWTVLPNDLTGQLPHIEATFQKKHSAEIKTIRDKMDEWSDAYRSQSPEQKRLKRELYALLSAYEKKTGGTFYQ